MPEIAEVRLIADNVRDFLKGNVLLDIETRTDNYKKADKLKGFRDVLPQRVADVKTKGKFTYILLDNDHAIGFGLGMSGNVRVEPTPEYLAVYNKKSGKRETAESYLKHAHLKIKYQNSKSGETEHFYYHDTRRFGNWGYLPPAELTKKLRSIGSDLIDETLTEEEVVKLFRRYNRRNICSLIMDQKFLGGVGNYMKAEILYDCKVHPLVNVSDLDDETIYKIYLAAKDIAYRAYTYGGASLYTYTGMSGDQSDFKTQLRIYNHSHDPFGNSVERITNTHSPDKRTIHWVPAVQTIGLPKKPKIKIAFKKT